VPKNWQFAINDNHDIVLQRLGAPGDANNTGSKKP